jgi:hypothetical protein
VFAADLETQTIPDSVGYRNLKMRIDYFRVAHRWLFVEPVHPIDPSHLPTFDETHMRFVDTWLINTLLSRRV